MEELPRIRIPAFIGGPGNRRLAKPEEQIELPLGAPGEILDALEKTTTSKLDEGLFSETITRIVNNECIVCGYPKPKSMELLSGERDFICPTCGQDNTPYDTEL